MMSKERIDRHLRMARMDLTSEHGDLDCSGWMLTKILEENPDNSEVADLLVQIIARINKDFDANEHRNLPCHLAMGDSSPSPYVRAIEARGIILW